MAHKTTESNPEWQIDMAVVENLIEGAREKMEKLNGPDAARETAIALVDKASEILRKYTVKLWG